VRTEPLEATRKALITYVPTYVLLHTVFGVYPLPPIFVPKSGKNYYYLLTMPSMVSCLSNKCEATTINEHRNLLLRDRCRCSSDKVMMIVVPSRRSSISTCL
jgi:hypothetical protein